MGRMSLYQCDRFDSKKLRKRKSKKIICICCKGSEKAFDTIDTREEHINKFCKTTDYAECEVYVKIKNRKPKLVYIKNADPIEIIEKYIHGQGQTHWVDRICGVI